jgi:hypothetical protein
MFWAPIVLAISEIDGGYLAQVECWRTGRPDELMRDEVVVRETACKVEKVEAVDDSAIRSGDPVSVVLRWVMKDETAV